MPPTPLLDIALQLSKFAAVGVLGTAAHYAALVGLVHGLGVDPVLASAVGFVLGALTNYALSYRYVFASRDRHLKTLPRFYAVASAGFLFNVAIMYAGVKLLGLNYFLVQIVATGSILLWNFAGNKLWTFAGTATLPKNAVARDGIEERDGAHL